MVAQATRAARAVMEVGSITTVGCLRSRIRRYAATRLEMAATPAWEEMGAMVGMVPLVAPGAMGAREMTVDRAALAAGSAA
jgi:hypothetical protein